MVDVVAVFGVMLDSSWLLPVLVVLIAVDAPLPVQPTETLLMCAAATASGADDVPAVLGLFVAALVGSAAGDLGTFGLGRSSHRTLSRAVDTECGLSAWVRRLRAAVRQVPVPVG